MMKHSQFVLGEICVESWPEAMIENNWCKICQIKLELQFSATDFKPFVPSW